MGEEITLDRLDERTKGHTAWMSGIEKKVDGLFLKIFFLIIASMGVNAGVVFAIVKAVVK